MRRYVRSIMLKRRDPVPPPRRKWVQESEVIPDRTPARQLAESIAKVLFGNPVMVNSFQYQRIEELIQEYTQRIKEQN